MTTCIMEYLQLFLVDLQGQNITWLCANFASSVKNHNLHFFFVFFYAQFEV